MNNHPPCIGLIEKQSFIYYKHTFINTHDTQEALHSTRDPPESGSMFHSGWSVIVTAVTWFHLYFHWAPVPSQDKLRVSKLTDVRRSFSGVGVFESVVSRGRTPENVGPETLVLKDTLRTTNWKKIMI